jgi:MFS family permease
VGHSGGCGSARRGKLTHAVAAAPMPRATRLFLAGNTVSMTGTGLVIAFTLIYLHQVRGIALPIVGALLAASAAAGLIVVPVSGILLDRLGARRVLTGIIFGQAVGQVLLAWAHSAATALPVMLLYGATWAPMFPALRTMIAGLTPDPAMQQRAFAINFTAQNAALGAGTLVGAAVANVHHAGSFQALFLANAASCLIFAAVLPFLPNLRSGPAKDERRTGYRDVLGHRGLRLVLMASLILAFTGTAAFDSGLPAYATVEAHVSAHVVALSLTVNTALIVVAQLFVLRVVRRTRRSRALAVSGLILAISWAVFGLAALPVPAMGRVAIVFGFTALFGLGETVLAPTVFPLVNSLTDDNVRGRANSLAAFSQSLALIVCPAIATGLIAADAGAAWIGLLCAGCLGTVVIAARLRRTLTPEQDHVPAAPAPNRQPLTSRCEECSQPA